MVMLVDTEIVDLIASEPKESIELLKKVMKFCRIDDETARVEETIGTIAAFVQCCHEKESKELSYPFSVLSMVMKKLEE